MLTTRTASEHLHPVRDEQGNGIGVVEFVDARATRSPWVARIPGYYGHSVRSYEAAERFIREVVANDPVFTR